MNEREKHGNDFLKVLREFLRFLQGLWGILGSISVFFPLSNVFTKLIPLYRHGSNDEGYRILSPDLITAFATLVTLFVILDTFSKRTLISGINFRRQAQKTFAFGVLMIISYLVVYFIPRFSCCGIQSGDALNLLFEIPLMFLYSLFFASITKAFMLLGMLEYFKKPDSPESPSEP
ncbi:MAG: hypothetical protein ACOZFS_15655 [Thermodesulfobacteriota bacterium]